MTTVYRAHYSALKERVEVTLFGATVAILADLAEVTSNILAHGITITHGAVFVALVIGGGIAIGELLFRHTYNYKTGLTVLRMKSIRQWQLKVRDNMSIGD